MDWSNLFQGEFGNWSWESWLIVGLGALVLIVLLFLLFKPKKKAPVTYKEVKVEPRTVTSNTTKQPESQTKPVETPKQEAPKAEPKAEPKSEPRTTAKVTEPQKETENDKVVKYHVSQNKDSKSEFKGQWRVRKEGSRKTIKHFKTQVEAIKYAESLADNNDTSIVIHKRDGTIRKQDYSKKKSS